MAAGSANTSSGGEPSSGRRRDGILFWVAAVAILVLLVATFVLLVAVFFPQIGVSTGRRWFLAITGAFLAVYPITFLAYRVNVHPRLKERLEKDIDFLGLDDEETGQLNAKELVEQTFNPWQFWLFIIPIIAVSLLIVLGYLMPDRLPNKELMERPMQLVFFSLLGAYVFSVQELVRRYQTNDLRPHVYATILVRILIAAMITFAAAAVIEAGGETIATTTPTPIATPTAVAVAATPAAPAVAVEMAEATLAAAGAASEIVAAEATAGVIAAEVTADVAIAEATAGVVLAEAEAEVAIAEATATAGAAEQAAGIAAAQATAVSEATATAESGAPAPPGDQSEKPPADPASGAAGWAVVLAFLIGMVPRRGTSWLSHRASVVLGEEQTITPIEPLSNLAGISPWHESRLLEMGIDDVQNLATANILELLLTTRFSAEQVVNWIDQAILHTRIGAQKFIVFRSHGINTYSDLRARLSRLPEPDPNGAAEKLRDQLGLNNVEMLATLGNPGPYANYASIQNYYHNRARYTDNLADNALSALLGEDGPVPLSPAETRLRDLNKLRSQEDRFVARRDRLSTGASNYEKAQTLAELAAIRLNIGRLESDTGKMEQARDDALQACTLAPALIAARITLCQAWYSLNRYGETITAAGIAIGRDPSRKEPYLLRGLARLEQAVALPPGEPRNVLLTQAGEDFDFALTLDDRDADAHLGRARTLLEQGAYLPALTAFETCQLLGDREDPNFWSAWGRALHQSGQNAEARSKLDRAIDLRPDDAVARRLRGIVNAQLGNWNAAINDLQLTPEGIPEPIVGQAFVAAAGMTATQPDAARAIYAAILTHAPAGSLYRQPARAAWEAITGTPWPGA